MLSVDETFDLEPALAHFLEHGYARLGRVMNDDTLQALRTRADDIMLGRVTYPGLFFQKGTETVETGRLVFGQRRILRLYVSRRLSQLSSRNKTPASHSPSDGMEAPSRRRVPGWMDYAKSSPARKRCHASETLRCLPP